MTGGRDGNTVEYIPYCVFTGHDFPLCSDVDLARMMIMATIIFGLMILSLLTVFALDIRQKQREVMPEANKHPNLHRE